jgi:hypothetical protein
LYSLQLAYPEKWEMFLKTGISDGLRSMKTRIEGFTQATKTCEKEDPAKITRYDTNTFVHGNKNKR